MMHGQTQIKINLCIPVASIVFSLFKIQMNDKPIDQMQRLLAYTSKTAEPGITEKSVHGTQGGGNAVASTEKR
jgi:hypothetical protein